MKARIISKTVTIIIFIVLILILAVSNFNIFWDAFQKYNNDEYTLSEMKDAISTTYVTEIKQKDDFINLNGLFARLTGKRTCNNVYRLNNGMLSSISVAYDTIHNAQRVEELAKQLKNASIDYVYVQLPAKMDINNQLLPYGITSEVNNNANQVVNYLKSNGVNVIDLRDTMADTPDHISEYFYKTDHHWTPVGAFKAFQEISLYLQKLYPDEEIDGYCQNIDNWDVRRKENWFLGSWGKRTGTLYAGSDDLVWLMPRFETEMSSSFVYEDEFFYGTFSDANIRSLYIDNKDYFRYNAYCVYMGGDYPLVKHRNAKATSELKILIVKDSFALPLEAFMSTVFKEVDVVDLRYYKAGSLDEYILDSKPDIVLMCYSAGSVDSDALFGTGADTNIIDEDNKTKIFHSDIEEIAVNPDSYTFKTIFNGVEGGERYTITCSTIIVTNGFTNGISVKLYDRQSDIVYDSDMWDLNYGETAGGFEWTFTAPDTENKLELLIYSGIPGKASNIGLEITGIDIYIY